MGKPIPPVFICYPETYTALCAVDRKDLVPEAQQRVRAICSSWHAALQTFGDRLAKVDVFIEENG